MDVVPHLSGFNWMLEEKVILRPLRGNSLLRPINTLIKRKIKTNLRKPAHVHAFAVLVDRRGVLVILFLEIKD